MTSIRRFAAVALVPVAIALLPVVAGAEVRDGGSELVSERLSRTSQDTTFTPVGSYSLDVAVGGQAMSMTFVAAKKEDGTIGGVFKHAEMGEFPTTSFKVEGRKLTMEIVTPGGPATVTLTVNKENVVEGEWSMQGDGSKISGKKNG